jgi:hypothetical protein
MLTNLPSVADAYDHENAFYLTCAPGRVGKLLAHYELYQRAQRVAGAFVECGIFKGHRSPVLRCSGTSSSLRKPAPSSASTSSESFRRRS